MQRKINRQNQQQINFTTTIYNYTTYGFPQQIHHDRGKESHNSLFQQLQQLCKFNSTKTTPYHSMGDGQTERMNRTIINMLKTLNSMKLGNPDGKTTL